MHFFFTWKRREQTKYKSHGKAYPKWLQTLLDRNWEGVAWNLIQGMAQCFFTQCFLFVWGKTFQTICYYDSWLCQALPWAKWNWLPCCPLPGQGQPWRTRNGALQSCWQHPQVFSCALCQLPWRIFFFLPFFPYLLHLLSTSRTAERSIWSFAANSRTCTGAPSLAGTKTTGYLNVSASSSSKQMFILKVIFPCVTVTEIFPSQVPYLHSSIWAGKGAGRATAFFPPQLSVMVNILRSLSLKVIKTALLPGPSLVWGCFPRASWEKAFKWLFRISQTFGVNFHSCEFILHA